MRTHSLLFICMATAGCLMAQRESFSTISQAEAERSAGSFGAPQSKVAMWIWSDKYTYTVGQNLTLKWTVKTNGDLYPYTVFVYRQNNQTGAKTYYPKGTAEVTDINGNTLAQGFQPIVLTDRTKAVLLGAGGIAGAVSIPGELGMSSFVVQLRDYTGTRILKTEMQKIGIVRSVQTISAPITSDLTMTNDTEWHLSGVVYVKNNATLTVEPGTFVIGNPGTSPPSALIVTQTGKIIANGTKSRPIVMTSSQPFGQRQRGDWGGLAMLGKAPINVAGNQPGGVGICPTTGCNNAQGTFFLEGLVGNADSVYGGNDPNHSCGSLKYVRVEYAGTILSPNNELNSFTWGGCGKGTVAEHLQAIYGKDDAFEWFGGNMDAKYLVGGLSADDYTDYQLGYTGRLQFIIGYQSPDAKGNRGIEGDNSEYDNAALPYSNPTIFNATYIGTGQPGFDEANAPGIFLRRGSRGYFANMVVNNFFSSCADITDASTQAQADQGNLKMDGILCFNNNLGTNSPNTADGQGSNAYTISYLKGEKGSGAAKNIVFANPLLARPFEYSDPDFQTLFSSPVFRAGFVAPPDDGFFDQTAQFLGGIGDDNWLDEWTSFLVESDIQ